MDGEADGGAEGGGEVGMTSRIQSCIDHIKTSVDIDPWAAELAEKALRQYEPRVMTLDEVKYSSDPVWLEWRNGYIKPAFLHSDQITTEDCRNAITLHTFFGSGSDEWHIFAEDDYGKEIRCWTSRPTEAQREAVPWN